MTSPSAPPRRKRRLWLLLLLAALSLASCGTVRFYGQAARGQAQILLKSKPIPEVLAQPELKPALRARLELVQMMRAFATKELGLPGEKSFGKYADLGRRYVSWVVYAAPELSVEPKTWWYPLVGRLQYRGFFSEDAAKAEADKLEAEGLDVFYGGVAAYSTLGWFHDPILNTFVGRSEGELAEPIFHELAHIKLFLPGDTEFNEALATAVGEEGARRWLRSRGEQSQLTEYEAALKKDMEIVNLLLQTHAELEKVYESGQTEGALRKVKQATFSQLKKDYSVIRQRWQGDSRYDRFFAKPMNNARLNTIAAYHQLLPRFEAKLRECGGDMGKFFTEMEKLREVDPKERLRSLPE